MWLVQDAVKRTRRSLARTDPLGEAQYRGRFAHRRRRSFLSSPRGSASPLPARPDEELLAFSPPVLFSRLRWLYGVRGGFL